MDAAEETLAEFKNSFSYGSRTDLAFKFLAKLPEADAAEFFRSLLEELGKSIDDGDAERLIRHAYEWQVAAYTPAPGAARSWVYDDGPFASPSPPLSEATVALLTSTGHYRAGDDPKPFGIEGMTQQEAVERISDFTRSAAELSAIPKTTADADLRVRHGGYDIRGAVADPAVAFPLSILRDLEQEGVIGELADPAWSFVGAASQKRLINERGPEWAALLAGAGVDVVLLVPV